MTDCLQQTTEPGQTSILILLYYYTASDTINVLFSSKDFRLILIYPTQLLVDFIPIILRVANMFTLVIPSLPSDSPDPHRSVIYFTFLSLSFNFFIYSLICFILNCFLRVLNSYFIFMPVTLKFILIVSLFFS